MNINEKSQAIYEVLKKEVASVAEYVRRTEMVEFSEENGSSQYVAEVFEGCVEVLKDMDFAAEFKDTVSFELPKLLEQELSFKASETKFYEQYKSAIQGLFKRRLFETDKGLMLREELKEILSQ
ncbi:MAG: hypothetical protein LBM93_14750 [Oscillospiraceae bacterium]|jgi:hypothetical protein|nr:hypothetical protein [Oscillospiraceae bacterium]